MNNINVKIEAVGSTTNAARELHVSNIYWEIPEEDSYDGDDCDPGQPGSGADDVNVTNSDPDNLRAEMASAAAGSEFCIEAGTYSSPDAGLPIQDGDELNGDADAYTTGGPTLDSPQPTVIIEAVNDAQFVIDGSSADDVIIRDVTLKGGEDETASIDPQASGDCTQGKDISDPPNPSVDIEDGQAQFCGTTVEAGNRWLIIESRITEGETRGIGSAGTDLVVFNSEIDHVGVFSDNNIKSGGCGNGEAAGGAILQTDGYDDYENPRDGNTTCPDNNGVSAGVKTGEAGAYVIHMSEVHDNDQGIWCDTDCENNNVPAAFFAYYNDVYDNGAFGIKVENTYKDEATGARSYIGNNDSKGNGWGEMPNEKADIGVVSAQNVFVYENAMGETTDAPGDTGDAGRAFAAFDRFEPEDPFGQPTGWEAFNDYDGETELCESPFDCTFP
jgi:hypothetical protein